LYIGLITSLLCAIYALYEDDLKAVLAYSTLSHIGFMMIPLGQNSQNLGFFHLYSHSFFKSLLFLIAGYLIIKYNENSIKKLKNKLTLFSPVGIIFTIGCLSLAGIFPLTGSFSKEHIIINFLNVEGYIPSVILIISIIFTCLYSSKLLFNVIKIEKNNFSNFFNSFNNELLYLVPITFLGILSLLGFFSQNFYLNFLNISFEEITIIQLLSIQLPIIFIFILNYFYEEKIKIITNDIIQISKYFIEIENIYRTLYRNIFVQFGKFIGWFDRNIIDGIINLPPYFIVNLSSYFQKVQNGFIRGYASKFIIIIIFVIIILGISYNI
jgi:NADH-quinone oxidoreductase subunit L